MNILCVCNTPLQLIFVLNLKITTFKNDDVDIILSDTMNNSKCLCERINNIKIFNKCYYVETFAFNRHLGKYKANSKLSKMWRKYRREKDCLEIFNFDRNYDMFMFNNFDEFNIGLGSYMLKKNKLLKICMFEDGYSTYCVQGDIFNEQRKKEKSTIFRLIGFFSHFINPLEYIDRIYLSSDRNMTWDPWFEISYVPICKENIPTLKNVLNKIYDYDNKVEKYNKLIFFEESYRVESNSISDIEIVNSIRDVFGIENMTIKLHPRSKENVFEKLGYHTNNNVEVPWELIVLNMEKPEEKIVVSIASGSIATPLSMFEINTKSISLIDFACVKPDKYNKIYYDYLRENIFGYYNIPCPKNIDELKMTIKELEKK